MCSRGTDFQISAANESAHWLFFPVLLQAALCVSSQNLVKNICITINDWITQHWRAVVNNVVRAAGPSLPFDGLLYKLCMFLVREISCLGGVHVVLVLVATCGCKCLSTRHSSGRNASFLTIWRTLSCNAATIQIVSFEKWDQCYSWEKEIKSKSWHWIWAKVWNASMGRSSLKWKRANWDTRKLDTDSECRSCLLLTANTIYVFINISFFHPPLLYLQVTSHFWYVYKARTLSLLLLI